MKTTIFHSTTAALWSLPLLLTCLLAALPAAAQQQRGGEAEWARLRFDTGNAAWNRHEYADLVLLERLDVDLSANFAATVHAASLFDLSAMVRYPFIFSYGLHRRPLGERQRENLREYMSRGGVLFVEECANREVTPDPLREFAGSVRFFRDLLPGATVSLLERDHEIFHCFYEMEQGLPFTRSPGYEYAKKTDGLAAVRYKGKTVALISSACLHCGWQGYGPPGNKERSLQMAVNIFVYLMTH